MGGMPAWQHGMKLKVRQAHTQQLCRSLGSCAPMQEQLGRRTTIGGPNMLRLHNSPLPSPHQAPPTLDGMHLQVKAKLPTVTTSDEEQGLQF